MRYPPEARRGAEAALLAAALAAAYLLVHPLTADHAAQEFRAELFAREGLQSWSNLWFGGHHLPGYSVLSPPLGALIGPRLLGAIAAVASAVLFSAVAKRRWGEEARVGILWFAAGTSISLFTGRITFALGVAVALAAVLFAQRGMRPAAIACAAICPLASPVAALFLACCGIAYSLAERSRAGIELAVAAAAVAGIVALAFPEGGSEPFVTSSFLPAILIAAVVFVALPREERLVRFGVATYAVALLGAYLIETPVGGNATRLGALLLGPLLACALWPRNRLLLAMLAPVLVVWQATPVIRDLERAGDERAVSAAYYEPLLDHLDRAAGDRPIRVEVLPTANHWEATYVPERIGIARGWERQLDRKLNPLFYDGALGAAEYRRWLELMAVSHVAVPDGSLDYAAEAEAALIEGGLPYLSSGRAVEHWRVYRVREPAPLASPPAELVALTADGFVLEANRAGVSEVRIRHTPYWSVTGAACVEESPDGFTRVSLERAGRVSVDASLAPWRALAGGPTCGGGA